jgi:molecular chaperone GrpE
MSDNKDQPTDIELDGADGQSQGDSNGQATPVPSEADTTTRIATAALPAPTPEERIGVLETEKAEMRDRMLRIAADFDNWKKRARKDQADGEARAKETVLRDFLEIVDNLERATASFGEAQDAPDAAKSIRDGVDLVLRQFRSKLERYQVKAIETLGQAFDPRLHEAISQIPSPEAKPGSIVHELQKGYMIGDKLLRPAMVVVAAAAPAAPASSDKSDADGASPRKEGED